MHCAGTFVNGQRLGKKECIVLTNDTSIVTFGTCPLQFQVRCEFILVIIVPLMKPCIAHLAEQAIIG